MYNKIFKTCNILLKVLTNKGVSGFKKLKSLSPTVGYVFPITTILSSIRCSRFNKILEHDI